jgi:hypothetical protein
MKSTALAVKACSNRDSEQTESFRIEAYLFEKRASIPLAVAPATHSISRLNCIVCNALSNVTPHEYVRKFSDDICYEGGMCALLFAAGGLAVC